MVKQTKSYCIAQGIPFDILINHYGKEYKKEYICVTDSLCCTTEIYNIVNQLYFNKINRSKKGENATKMCVAILSIIEKNLYIQKLPTAGWISELWYTHTMKYCRGVKMNCGSFYQYE